jgi:hypothetical protein
MRRLIQLLVGGVAIASAIAEDELPKAEEGEPFEIEPPLLIQSRAADGSLPDFPMPETPVPDVDLVRLEAQLVRARKNAAAGERLYQQGIIAKVEVEERALKIVRLRAMFAAARLEIAREKAEEEKRRHAADEISGDDLQAADGELARAKEAAQEAAEEGQRAEVEAAARNLERQRKLFALGSGRKADVNRAEQKLAELKRAED